MSSWAARAKPVAVEKRVDTPDRQGGVKRTWITHVMSRATIDSVVGSEEFATGRLESQMTHKLRFRWQLSLAAQTSVVMRVRYGNRVFSVVSVVDPEEAHGWLDFMCREDIGIVAAG